MLIEHALLAFCIGAFIGKFLALEAHDLPLILLEGCQEGKEPRDILKRFFQFSECKNCHYPIRGVANIPIIGYLLLRGKCPNCLHPLYFQTFLLELGIALLFGITAFLFLLPLPWVEKCQELIELQRQLTHLYWKEHFHIQRFLPLLTSTPHFQ